jgi:diadenosine tetraphosphatase ApaH/serine/threonine PP2A family protein phosphatase
MRKSQLLTAIEKALQTSAALGLSTIQEKQQMEASKFALSQEASKFELGQDDLVGGPFTSVDEGLGELPAGYGESRIVLMPRDPQWAYVYWDVPNEQKEELRRQGGQQLVLRLYDVTDIDSNFQNSHSVQEYLCDELARAGMAAMEAHSGLHGHTHLPIAYIEEDGRLETMSPGSGSKLTFDGRRVLLNPGSVGQPRDGIPTAGWMLLDTGAGTATWRRTAYDIAEVQATMSRLHLPERLVARLAYGL